jgi:hypothetical protein
VNRWALIVVAAVVAVAVDLAVGASIPGLTATIGFAGCAVIILASKWLGRSLLQRPEVFYERPIVQEGLGDDA